MYIAKQKRFFREGFEHMKVIHGGDIYSNQIKYDFSVNINPLGVPEKVKAALHEAVNDCSNYPDISSEKLADAVSEMLSVSKDHLLFGNGASELFMAVIHAIRPEKTVIPIPSFYGYEHAAKANSGEIIYYETKDCNDFGIKENILSILTDDVDLLFLANPNNPTGTLIGRECLLKILKHCLMKNIYVVLDECFIEFCDKGLSMTKEIDSFPNLIIIMAFTKIYSIPGVRLGYLISSNTSILNAINNQLPEWNISVFAERAGSACRGLNGFIDETIKYVDTERRYMNDNLLKLGFKVIPGKANFLLFYTDQPLYDQLLDKEILIRDCSNFRGLSKGYYRIAIKTRKENEILLKAIGELNHI